MTGLIGVFPVYGFLYSHSHQNYEKIMSLLLNIGVKEELLQPAILLLILLFLVFASELLFYIFSFFYHNTATNKEIEKISAVPVSTFKRILLLVHKYEDYKFDDYADIINIDYEDLRAYFEILISEGFLAKSVGGYYLTIKGKKFISKNLI